MMSNQTYDILKRCCQIYLPALGTLYFALAQIWNLPYGEQIVGTITAVVTFLGVCLQISSNQYVEEDTVDDIDDILEDDEDVYIEE